MSNASHLPDSSAKGATQAELQGDPRRIFLYSRFERINHWLQAALVLTLLVTGFEVHGSYSLLGYENAFHTHNFCAWAWLVLFIFDLFYLAVTGEWRQYAPTYRKLWDVAHYYMVGIFRGEKHPVPKSERAKHNPLQRLTYLGVVTVLIPFQMATGFVYYYYNELNPSLGFVAALHTIGAFAFLIFLIVHVYMTTTGHTVFCHIKAMCTGWEEVEGHCRLPETEAKEGRAKA